MPDQNHSALKHWSALGLLSISLLQAFVHAHAAMIEAFEPQAENYNVSLVDLKENPHALKDYRGKVVLINFWASWCPPCIHEMPSLMKLKRGLSDKPFEIITINVGEKRFKVTKFTNIINLDLPVLLDEDNKTFNEWNVRTLPTSFLVDAKGTIRYQIIGNPGWDSTKTSNLIDELLTEASERTTKQHMGPEEK